MYTSHCFKKKQVCKSISKLHDHVSNFIFNDCLAVCNEGKLAWQQDLVIQFNRSSSGFASKFFGPCPTHHTIRLGSPTFLRAIFLVELVFFLIPDQIFVFHVKKIWSMPYTC